MAAVKLLHSPPMEVAAEVMAAGVPLEEDMGLAARPQVEEVMEGAIMAVRRLSQEEAATAAEGEVGLEDEAEEGVAATVKIHMGEDVGAGVDEEAGLDEEATTEEEVEETATEVEWEDAAAEMIAADLAAVAEALVAVAEDTVEEAMEEAGSLIKSSRTTRFTSPASRRI